MSKKPVIGISTSIIIDSGGIFPGYHRMYVNRDYVDAVTKCGATPIMIPLTTDKDTIKDIVSLCDGIIISGGHDVAPQNYGQEPRQALGDIFPERDEYEFEILNCAEKENLPVLGICRGLQIINTHFGGTLHQDLSYINSEVPVLKHNQNQTPGLKTHTVTLTAGSTFETLWGKETGVNSFHHQVIDSVAPGFKVGAVAKDGVVEAIERPGTPHILGVQWHPEMLASSDENMAHLFEHFIGLSRK